MRLRSYPCTQPSKERKLSPKRVIIRSREMQTIFFRISATCAFNSVAGSSLLVLRHCENILRYSKVPQHFRTLQAHFWRSKRHGRRKRKASPSAIAPEVRTPCVKVRWYWSKGRRISRRLCTKYLKNWQRLPSTGGDCLRRHILHRSRGN